MKTVYLGLAAAMLVAGCGGRQASVEATTDTFRGAERLHYPATRAPALDWSVDSVGAIGNAFGDENYQFGSIARIGLAGDSAGDLYVLDTQARHVQKYGPDGRYLASYGRKGGGPGELEQPLSLALGPGDSLWVADFSNTRFTILPQDGGDARSIRFPESAFPMSGLVVGRDAYVVADRVLNFGVGPSSSNSDGAAGIPVVAYGFDGAPLDTLWTAPPPEMDRVELQSASQRMVMLAARAFSPELRFAAFSDGTLAVSDTAAYLVALLSAQGNVRRWIQRDPPPRQTTDADREAERDRVRRQSSQSGGARIRVGGGGGAEGGSDPLLEQRLAKMTFENLVPRIAGLAVDPQDRLWIGVSEDTPGEVQRIDVYDRDGRLLGELRGVPFPDVFLGRDRMGVITRDALDVPHIVLYRITARPAAS
ncbi:MAG TPA: hypothetical protein VJ957_08395 [Longimicrobiales bacterium]|nr:hypothetical protein [Longimicrobiales bacterium]